MVSEYASSKISRNCVKIALALTIKRERNVEVYEVRARESENRNVAP